MKHNITMARMTSLMKKDYWLYAKSILIFFFASVFACSLVNYLLPIGWTATFANYRVYYVKIEIILVVNAILTSFAFTELDSSGKKIAFFLEPATLIEKYLSRWVTTLIVFFIFAILLYLFNFFIVIILNFNTPMDLKTNIQTIISGENGLKYLKFYVLVHAVFFYGAVTFNKNSFLKTAIACFAVIVSLILIIKLLTLILVPSVEVSLLLKLDDNVFYYSEEAYHKFTAYRNTIGHFVTLIAFYIMPPFLWILGYFRLKEEEVQNGIQ